MVVAMLLKKTPLSGHSLKLHVGRSGRNQISRIARKKCSQLLQLPEQLHLHGEEGSGPRALREGRQLVHGDGPRLWTNDDHDAFDTAFNSALFTTAET